MRFLEIATHHLRPRCIVGLAILLAAACPAEGFKARIRANGTQGDLVQIRQDGNEQTLRLYGVACPVSGQPMAESATTRILEAAMDASVIVEIVGKDSSGTPVAWVRLPDGTSLNEQLVREGLAWWDSPNTPDDRPLQRAATEAIATRRGLWASPAPLAPWDYRASHGLAEVKYQKPEAESVPVKTKTSRPQVVPSLKARGEKDSDDDGHREQARGGKRDDDDKDERAGGKDDDDKDEKAGGKDDDDKDEKAGGKDDDDDKDEKAGGKDDDDDKGEKQGKGDYFPEDPAEHMALMLKHQPRIAYDKAGKPLGLTATDIASVPGAGRIGLQDGDIVSSVNGIALTDAAQVLGMVTQFQGAKQLELTVMRQGKPTIITIPLK